MLGCVISDEGRRTDAMLGRVAARLADEGARVIGVVQVDTDRPGRPCDMDLHLLLGGEVIRISQDLGAHARGCRLDPAALEGAAGRVAAALAAGAEGEAGGVPRILVLNKFGKQELEGRGFRPLIGEALGAGVPVLVGLRPGARAGFAAFAGELAEMLPDDEAAVLAWARDSLA